MSCKSLGLGAGLVLLLACLGAAPLTAAPGPRGLVAPEPAARSLLADLWTLFGRLFQTDTADNRCSIDPDGCPAATGDNRGSIDPNGLLSEPDNRGTIDPNG